MPDVTNTSQCASELAIDEALTGELPMHALSQLERHREQCAQCHARWDGIVRERATFLSTAPSFEALGARVERAQRRRAARRTPGLALGVLATGAAAAAVLLLVRAPDAGVAPDARPGSETGNPAAERSKGGPRIGFFIKRGTLVRAGHNGAVVQPGDRLRFVYSSDTPRHLALFNLDGRGSSTYYPPQPTAARVGAGREVALDFSVELDDYVGDERVFAVFCEAPFELEPLRHELAQHNALRARAGCVVDSLRLVKKEPSP
jgi:hypothetical protein